MGWKEAWEARQASVFFTPKRSGKDLEARLASVAAGYDPLAGARVLESDPGTRRSETLVVLTFDASGEVFRFAVKFRPSLPADLLWVATREALARLYVHPGWQDFDPQVSHEDAEQALRVAETKAWAARRVLGITNETEAEMAKKQRAESEMTEITIRGLPFRSRDEFTVGYAATLGDDENEGEGGITISVVHEDPDLDAMLAPGGKYSVTIRREEGS